jgi:chromosome segregation ATPase
MAQEAPNKQPDDKTNPEIASTKTTIDSLLDLLRTKGRTELSSVAVALNIDPRIIENWAKVLEKGNLIKITYEVGKMYLEPISLSLEEQADVKTKTDITKFILEEDLAVERISLDKFSKSISDLNTTIGTMEKLYQQKMPAVQKILAEVDRAYAPVESKKKSIDRIKLDADADLKEVNKTIETLSTKLNAFSPTRTDSEVSSKLEKLNAILANMDSAQKAMDETERTKDRFFDSMKANINTQLNELKKQLSSSRNDIGQNLKENARQLKELIKGIQDQVGTAKRLAKETEGFKRQFDTAKRDLEVLRSDFNDRYERLREGIEKDSMLVDSQSKNVLENIKDLKSQIGGISKIDDDIRRWKKNMSDLSREIVSTKGEIIKLTNQLNIIDTNKSITVERKAKAIEEVSKSANNTKKATSRIKEVIKNTADEIRRREEGKEGGEDG